MKTHDILLALVALVSSVCVTGCQTAQYIQHSPQTHFDFANSNVKPIGPVKVEVPGPSSFMKDPPIISSDSDQKVYEAALAQQPGADLIIDYNKTYKSYGFLFFGWSKLQLEGTAVKMEVGKQILK